MSRHWDPIRDLMLLQDRMNQLFEDATERRAREGAEARDEIERPDWIPVADVSERPEGYVVAVDLPGIERSALEINLENERLSIKGTRVFENGGAAQPKRERPQGKFNRTFAVPAAVDPEQIEAEYKEQKTQAVKIKVS
jgi:HSP20 family protein